MAPILLALSALMAVSAALVDDGRCRCFPSDPCWPTREEWQHFNETVGGRLIKTVPIAAACHDSEFGAYDEGKCALIRDAWGYVETHISSSSSPMAAVFANASCDPWTDASAQCIVGTQVQYTVNASCAADYQATLAFAQARNIRLVVRNTGHDYLGKSTGAGALGLWTRHLKSIDVVDFDAPYYRGKALRVGAGVDMAQAQAYAHARGLVVVTGSCPSVGFTGGFTQGGGLGPLSTMFGLAADQVLAWDVVTATGSRLTATPRKHASLYWALSGGGGGTYAVALGMTVRVYPDMRVAAANLTFSGQGVAPETYYGIVQTFLSGLPHMLDAGTASTVLLAGDVFALQPLMGAALTKAQVLELLRPTLDALDKSGVPYNLSIDEFSTYLDAYTAYTPRLDVIEINMGGRLLPRSVVASSASSKALVDAFRFIVDSGSIVYVTALDVSHGQKVDNAVNPAWRDAIISAVIGLPYNATDFDANLAAQERVTRELVPRLAALSPRGGAYLNEADVNQPDWQSVFYGKAYERLREVKDKYDPLGMLYAVTAPGSERWVVEEGGRLCRA